MSGAKYTQLSQITITNHSSVRGVSDAPHLLGPAALKIISSAGRSF